jgi:hypothetical protein
MAPRSAAAMLLLQPPRPQEMMMTTLTLSVTRMLVDDRIRNLRAEAGTARFFDTDGDAIETQPPLRRPRAIRMPSFVRRIAGAAGF